MIKVIIIKINFFFDLFKNIVDVIIKENIE